MFSSLPIVRLVPCVTLVALTLMLNLPTAVMGDPPAPGDDVAVRTSSGHTFKGAIDARTNSQQLWVRFGNGQAYLLQPIPWDRVVSGRHAGTTVDQQELRLLADKIKSKSDRDTTTVKAGDGRTNRETPGDEVDGARDSADSGVRVVENRRAKLGWASRICSVRVKAYVANWDADVETDGVILHVFPLDAAGHVVPIRGTLAVELVGVPRGRRNFAAAYLNRADIVEPIARWTKRIKTRDVGKQGGAVFKLPFQRVHPGFDREMGRYGLVHVRLVVAGSGVFEASQDAVPLRSFSPIRDASERSQSQRFLPNELLGRGRH